MLLEKELSDFNSDMYLNLIMEFNNDIEFGELNKFSEEEDLKTLDVDQLMNRLEKSLSVSLDKVEKMLHKKLEACDLIRLCHIGIEIANAKFESSKKQRSAECDGSTPNKKKLMEIRILNPIQNAIPIDLERRLTEMEYSSHTGPPGDLDDNKKRWLVVGIGLHSILSPALRKYVEPVLTNFYKALKLSDQIDKQSHPRYLRTNGVRNVYLNYEAINMNKTTHGYRQQLYDYKVQNAVDLSKLFLPTHMTHYSAFDESCDSSALLGLIDKIDKFPGNVRTAANDVRTTIRNEWAHCNFTVWDDAKYVQSLQLIEHVIYLLNLNAVEKKRMIEELDKWRKNGTSFLQGYTISFELVNEISQKIQILVEYTEVISKTADKEFGKVHEALIDIGETLSQYDERISTLENRVAVQGNALKEYGSLYDSDVHEIKLWKQDSKYFIKTDIVPDILRILEDKHCVLLTGVSGIGKTLTAQNIALKLLHEFQYSIVPCVSLHDIATRYKEHVRQVFVVDDICGKYIANINIIENWRNITNRVKSILDKGITKILATCRTEVSKEKIFQQAFDLFHKNAYNLSDNYSLKDKLVIASKHLEHYDKMLPDITNIINKKTFSPLMCFLCSRHKNFDINEFLNSPFDTFCKEWDDLKSFDKEKFCVLLLCVIHNGTINDDFFDISKDLEKDEKKKLKDIFEWCSLNRGTSRSALQSKMNVCIDTYFRKVNKEFKVLHDKMFDFLCSFFGKTLLDPILKYAHDKVICERVQLESLQEAHGYFTIMVSKHDEHKYNDRIKADLENGKIHWCLNNSQMKFKEYRIKIRDIIKDLEINLIRNLINIKDDNGINSFIIACLRGYDELVDFFISVGADVDGQIGFFTPLTAACHDGHLKTVEILLKGGSNIDNANSQGETPLYTACVGGHYSLVQLLIEKDADINKQNKYSRTPLYTSCMLDHATIVSLLIDKGANVYQYKDVIIAATLGGNDKIVEKLITNDCCLNSVDIEGKTALFIACEEGYIKIVKLLIDNNADIYKVDSHGNTPLHATCCAGNYDIVSMLICKGSDINMIDVDLETPLHKACRKGSLGVIQKLLDFGADINKANGDVHTPAHIAKSEGAIMDEHILKSLEENKTEPTEQQNLTNSNRKIVTNNLIRFGWTPLYEACINGDIETVTSLIRNRANVNMKTDSGEMPLVAVCQQGHGFLLQVLLDKGADVDEALCCAVQKGYIRTINMLLYKGGDVSYKGVDGKSLLTLACEQGSVEIVKILLGKGADLNDVNGQTLIHIVCKTDDDDLLKLLLDMGLDLTIHDENGRYPLFVSLDKGFDNLSKHLIKQSCSIAISERDKKTALISAFESGNMELSKSLVLNGYAENLSQFNEIMLYHACRLGLRENVEILHRNGTDNKTIYKFKYTLMILADIGGNDDLSEYLQNSITSSLTNTERLRIGRPINNYCLSYGNYEVQIQACMNGEIKLERTKRNFFDIFIEQNESIWFEQTPLCLEIRRGQSDRVKFLIKHGVNVNLTFEDRSFDAPFLLFSMAVKYGYTPLFAACQRKCNEIVIMLLENGANVNKALYDACREGYLDTVQFLLQKGADVNSIGRFGQTALYAACIGGYSTIVKYLIDQGSVIDTKVKCERFIHEPTCLHAAYQRNNYKTVQLLIKRGASIDTVDNFNRTMLNKACWDGNYKIVEILMNKGVDINASDSYGATPLVLSVLQTIEDKHEENAYIREMRNDYSFDVHFFNQEYVTGWNTYSKLDFESNINNHFEVIQLLVGNGADINKADTEGRTPLSLAKEIGNMQLTEILLHKVLLQCKM